MGGAWFQVVISTVLEKFAINYIYAVLLNTIQTPATTSHQLELKNINM